MKNTSDLPRACLWCENASPLRSDNDMLCRLRGVVSSDHVCRKFMYDPLKRRPHAPPTPPKLEPLSDDVTEN